LGCKWSSSAPRGLPGKLCSQGSRLLAPSVSTPGTLTSRARWPGPGPRAYSNQLSGAHTGHLRVTGRPCLCLWLLTTTPPPASAWDGSLLALDVTWGPPCGSTSATVGICQCGHYMSSSGLCLDSVVLIILEWPTLPSAGGGVMRTDCGERSHFHPRPPTRLGRGHWRACSVPCQSEGCKSWVRKQRTCVGSPGKARRIRKGGHYAFMIVLPTHEFTLLD
jgi:hypothetical protein